MAFEGAILDFDGTLVDSIDAWHDLEGVLAVKRRRPSRLKIASSLFRCRSMRSHSGSMGVSA